MIINNTFKKIYKKNNNNILITFLFPIKIMSTNFKMNYKQK